MHDAGAEQSGRPAMNPDGWLHALDKLIQMNPAIVVPGHGRDGTVDALKGQRAYLSAIFDQVKAGIANRETPDQVYSHIEWSKYKPWSDDEKRNHTAVTAAYQNINARSKAEHP